MLAAENIRKFSNQRGPGTPLATWQKAFIGYDIICLEEQINDQWLHWPFTISPDKLSPGDSEPPPTIEGYIIKIVDWICKQHNDFTEKTNPAVYVELLAQNNSPSRTSIKEKYAQFLSQNPTESKDTWALLISAASNAATLKSYSSLKTFWMI